MKNIPIVVLSDKKLNFSVATLFINLLEKADEDTFYELNVIVSTDFEEIDIEKIKSIENQYKNCKIEFVRMDNRFEKSRNLHIYVTNTCLFKMILAEKLPQYDKVIYLDTDLIIHKDLSEMFEIDMKDNYIAGVHTPYTQIRFPKLRIRLKLPNLNQYVNAGVLIFNLKAIRENNVEAELHKYIGQFSGSVDQHIFNKVCYNKIYHIDTNWNYIRNEEEFLKNGSYDENTDYYKKLSGVEKTHYVYHYTGVKKPWNDFSVRYQREWLGYAKKSPYYPQIIVGLITYPFVSTIKLYLKNILKFILKFSKKLFIALGKTRALIKLFVVNVL